MQTENSKAIQTDMLSDFDSTNELHVSFCYKTQIINNFQLEKYIIYFFQSFSYSEKFYNLKQNVKESNEDMKIQNG